MSRLSSAEDDDRLLADVVVAAAPPQPEPQRWLRPRGTTWSVLGYLRVVAQRLHHSRSLSVFYVCMIIINCVVLAWTVLSPSGAPAPRLLFGLEVFVTAMLVLELLLRLAAQRSRFWRSWSNLFDVFVTVVCVAAVAMLAAAAQPASRTEVEDLLAFGLAVLRYSAPALRMATWVKNRTQVQAQQRAGIVDFSQLAEQGSDAFDGVQLVQPRQEGGSAELGEGDERTDSDQWGAAWGAPLSLRLDSGRPAAASPCSATAGTAASAAVSASEPRASPSTELKRDSERSDSEGAGADEGGDGGSDAGSTSSSTTTTTTTATTVTATFTTATATATATAPAAAVAAGASSIALPPPRSSPPAARSVQPPDAGKRE